MTNIASFVFRVASDGAGNRFVSGDSTAGDEVCVFYLLRYASLLKLKKNEKIVLFSSLSPFLVRQL